MPPRKSKTTMKREAKPKTDSAKTVKKVIVKVKLGVTVVTDATSVVVGATSVVTNATSVVSNATSVVSDATSVVTRNKPTQEDDTNWIQESESRLDSDDDGRNNSSVLLTPEKTPRKLPFPSTAHIITTPPVVQSPKHRTDGKHGQKTLDSIEEKVDFISRECPYETLDSPAAKHARGKRTRKRGGTTTGGSSGTRGCRRKEASASRVSLQVTSDNNIPNKCRSTIDSKSLVKEEPLSSSSADDERSQDIKIESSSDGVNKTMQLKTKISDYYPIRRSSRRTEAELKKEMDQNFQDCVESVQQDGLQIQEIFSKGRGIVATRSFTRNEFVVEYAGDLIDVTAAKLRESEYLAKKSGCYMYYFKHKNINYCIDATSESPYFGRLVNHSRVKPNCHTKVVEVKGQPHLVLVASRKIEIGEELLYDYGDRSKEALAAHPWLAF